MTIGPEPGGTFAPIGEPDLSAIPQPDPPDPPRIDPPPPTPGATTTPPPAPSEPVSDAPVRPTDAFEIWRAADNQFYLVYMMPGLDEGDPPIPLAYNIPGQQEFEDIFGAGAGVTSLAEEGFTVRWWSPAAGPVVLGSTNLIPNPYDDNAFDTFLELYERQAETQPWLRDPEILALVVGTELIEDRQLTPEEWAQTEWWQTHSEAERAWLTLVNSDPATADQALEDQRVAARQLLISSGVASPDEALVRFIADKVTMGSWTSTYANQQIVKLSDPFAPGDLDGELVAFGDVDTTRAGEQDVRDLITEWLGPRFSEGWSQEWVEQWAGRIRNDPDAEQELVERLRQHRLAMYPENQDPTVTYEDLAGPWRGVVTDLWGQVPDETDPIFSQVLRLNDLGEAQKLLRNEGLRRGNVTVVNNALQGLATAFGQPIRRADEAIR